jgi:hypothetical protein
VENDDFLLLLMRMLLWGIKLLHYFHQQLPVDHHARIQRYYRDLADISAPTRHLHRLHAPAVREDREHTLTYYYTHPLLV